MEKATGLIIGNNPWKTGLLRVSRSGTQTKIFPQWNVMKTTRQQIIDVLEQMELDALDISQELRIGEKEVYDHLPHVARSVRSKGKQLTIRPANCLKCGYVFEGRTRFTRPGRCPRCRETHVQRPTYRIE